MVNKGSSFPDFLRFRPNTYARTQQSLSPLWAADIRSWNSWNGYIIIRLLSAYCSWWWLILEVKTPEIGIYTAADDDLHWIKYSRNLTALKPTDLALKYHKSLFNITRNWKQQNWVKKHVALGYFLN